MCRSRLLSEVSSLLAEAPVARVSNAVGPPSHPEGGSSLSLKLMHRRLSIRRSELLSSVRLIGFCVGVRCRGLNMSTFCKRKGGGRRSVTRSPVPLIAMVKTLKGAHSSVVIDVSASGARLRGHDLPHCHADLPVTVAGISAFGTIAWADGNERGAAFDAPLSARDKRLLRQKVAQFRAMPAAIRAAFDDWTMGFAR